MKKPTETQLYILARLAHKPGWRIKYLGQSYWLVDTRDAPRHQVHDRTLHALVQAEWIQPSIRGMYRITGTGRSVAPASPRWMP